jgi:hypothetical protein
MLADYAFGVMAPSPDWKADYDQRFSKLSKELSASSQDKNLWLWELAML